jgi:siroheme synthase-like protein
MFPIALDLAKISVLLIGGGVALRSREAQLRKYGAMNLSVLPLQEGWNPDFSNNTVIMIAGLSREVSEKLSAAARAAGKLVNVEDMNDLCDFYFTANIKRGDLLIAVSTGGASPTLSRKIRDYIADKFGVEWEARIAEIAEFRQKLKAQNKTIPEVLNESEKFLADKGWLNE